MEHIPATTDRNAITILEERMIAPGDFLVIEAAIKQLKGAKCGMFTAIMHPQTYRKIQSRRKLKRAVRRLYNAGRSRIKLNEQTN